MTDKMAKNGRDELLGAAKKKEDEIAKNANKGIGLVEGYEEKQRRNQTLAMMQGEVSQMEEVNKTIGIPISSHLLDGISVNLKKTSTKYMDYDNLIGHSGKHVTDLTRK